MTDEKLIEGCIHDDRRCQNELYKRYFTMMSSITMRYTIDQDQALHVLNGGFLKVLQNIKKYDNQYAIATWIRNIMINHVIDEYRKEKKYQMNIQLTEIENDHQVSFNAGESHIQEQDLRALLRALPKVTQKVFNLFAIDGFKHREISDYLGITEGASKWHVNEARKKLKGMLEKQADLEKKVLKQN